VTGRCGLMAPPKLALETMEGGARIAALATPRPLTVTISRSLLNPMEANLSCFARPIQPSTIRTTAGLAGFQHARKPRSFWLRLKHSNSSFRGRAFGQYWPTRGAAPNSTLPLVVMDSGFEAAPRPEMTDT